MNHKRKSGFTLIELILAMAFLSALLLAIAMTVIQIGATYNRGIMLKDVDQLGRSISSELQAGISSSSPFDLGDNFIDNEWGGRLCVSGYSYIWNYGKTLDKANPLDSNKYKDSPNLPPIHFLKARDPGGFYCADSSKPIDSNSSTELLVSSDHDLAIHKFNIGSAVSAIDAKSRSQLYTVTFIIGTNDNEALSNDASSCKAPGEAGSDINHCSVQEFSIAIRAGNSVK